MLYIHGGGYQSGSGNASSYGPDYLVEKDVVVVTINYRVGALGFLCLNTPETPGNAGLKDMIQAIRWVKSNIGSFGGNSGNLTLFGESAGGAAVSTLTASPLTKDLISKAILQSSIAIDDYAIQNNPLENAGKLAETLGCDARNVDDIHEFLMTTPAKEIVEANEKMYPPFKTFVERVSDLFAPVVEKEFPGIEPALTENFLDLLTTGRISKIPVMIGTTTLEFCLATTPDEDLRVFIPAEFNVERNSEEAVSLADQIKSVYFKSGHIGLENIIDYFELVSDFLTNINTHRYVKYLVQNTTKPVYYYKFDYVGELNASKKLLDSFGIKHASHTDELGYLFKNDLQGDVVPTPQDTKMREIIVSLWTNFAKTGNPTPDENQLITVTWLPVTKDNMYYLNLSNELSLETNPNHERMLFWEDLYNKYYKIWESKKATEDIFKKTEPQNDSDITEEAATVTSEIIEVIAQMDNLIVANESADLVDNTIEVAIDDPPTIIDQPLVDVEPIEESVPEHVKEVLAEAVKEVIREVNGKAEENDAIRALKPSNEIKVVTHSNGGPRDIIRANDPPEDDLPKNIGINKFLNFFESLNKK